MTMMPDPARYEEMVFQEGRRRGREEALKSLKTKTIKYFDDDEKAWKIGEVIVDEAD